MVFRPSVMGTLTVNGTDVVKVVDNVSTTLRLEVKVREVVIVVVMLSVRVVP